jgi:hypothetical protein
LVYTAKVDYSDPTLNQPATQVLSETTSFWLKFDATARRFYGRPVYTDIKDLGLL